MARGNCENRAATLPYRRKIFPAKWKSSREDFRFSTEYRWTGILSIVLFVRLARLKITCVEWKAVKIAETERREKLQTRRRRGRVFGLATKWSRVLSVRANGKIRNHLVAVIHYIVTWWTFVLFFFCKHILYDVTFFILRGKSGSHVTR